MAYLSFANAVRGTVNGNPTWIVYGTPGDDVIRINAPGQNVTVVGGAGSDNITKTPGTGRLNVYGDNADPATGLRAIGSLAARGNDVLAVGPNDTVYSGDGRDIYDLHGLGEQFAGRNAATIFANIRADDIILAASNGVEVDDWRFESIERDGNVRIGTIRSITLEGRDDNRLLDGQRVEVDLFRQRVLEDRPEFTVRWEVNNVNTLIADNQRIAVENFVARGEDEWWFG